MASTYCQIYIQVVFSPFKHENCIVESWSNELYQYITGIVRNKGQKLIAINGMHDHIHIFLGIKPSIALSDIVETLKITLQILLTKNTLLRGNLCGRRDMALFPIAIPK
jgi:REP element-mobilizing transposase RayT